MQNTHRARPVPSAVTDKVPIKLNAAAILREEAYHRRLVEEEEGRLAKIEAGDFDEEQFRIEQLVRRTAWRVALSGSFCLRRKRQCAVFFLFTHLQHHLHPCPSAVPRRSGEQRMKRRSA